MTLNYPSSIDAEKLVLGSALSLEENLTTVVSDLTKDDFFSSQNKTIFSSLKELNAKIKSIDLYLIIDYLKSHNQLDLAGGEGYISELFQLSLHGHLFNEYVEILKEKTLLRELITFGQCLWQNASKNPKDSSLFIDEAQTDFFRIIQRGGGDFGYTAKDILMGESEGGKPIMETITEKQAYYSEHGKIQIDESLIPTGFIDLDKIIDGFGKGQFIIVAGRPGMGKTTFVLNLLHTLSVKNSASSGFFTIEMRESELMYKLLAIESQVPQKNIQKGALTSDEFTRVYGASKALLGKSIRFDGSKTLDISTLRMRARRMKDSDKIEILFVDYLQLMNGSKKMENRNLEISEISRGLKTLAGELNIPIISIAQLSRKPEQRENKIPLISDLRDSGALEQDADKILFIHCPDVEDKHDKPGMAQIVVAKNRQGETGFCNLAFLKDKSLFTNTIYEDFSEKEEVQVGDRYWSR